MKRYLGILGFAVLFVVISGGIWLFLTYYEGENPEIALSRDVTVIGQRTVFDVVCTDEKSGIRSVTVTLSQDSKRHTVESVELTKRGTLRKVIPVELRPADLRLDDGDATIDISVTDYSLRKNKVSQTFGVVIDTNPPRISPVSTFHYINPGGACVAVYTLSEAVQRTGVRVGSDFFVSYPETGTGADRRHVCYFSLPCIDIPKDVKIDILSEDNAGNTTVFPLPFRIMNKTFRNDRMNISQQFLEKKMPEFQHRFKTLEGMSLLDTFTYVNSQMRAQDKERIEGLCKNTRPEKLWDGPFLRMKNTATMATFGDRRTYYCDGAEISRSIHQGVDLASTRAARVEASNNGIVTFTGYLGIYGNTVIIDHGMGVFSLYAHLSSIGINKGQAVARGDIIGRTGMTGLAGGDHLHFSMIVGGKFVNPVEWWDPHWIQDNVTRKLSRE